MMIYDWSRHQAERNPWQIAITLSNKHLSYGLLESNSNRLAGMLLMAGLKPGDRVGLLTEKTIEAVTSILAIAKAGGTYVMLDYKSRETGLDMILRSCDVKFLMADHHSRTKLQSLTDRYPEHRSIPWIWCSVKPCPLHNRVQPCFSWAEIDSHPDYPYGRVRDENHPAQILFPPGPAIDPKGTVITHKNIVILGRWALIHFNMKPQDRISAYSPLHIELSTFDLFSSMAAGSHLYLVPREAAVSPGRLSSFILENDLTQWFSTPSVLSHMARFEVIPEGGFPGLERVIWSGTIFPLPAIRYWMKHLPHATFTNLHGPTEVNLADSYYSLQKYWKPFEASEERTENPDQKTMSEPLEQ